MRNENGEIIYEGTSAPAIANLDCLIEHTKTVRTPMGSKEPVHIMYHLIEKFSQDMQDERVAAEELFETERLAAEALALKESLDVIARTNKSLELLETFEARLVKYETLWVNRTVAELKVVAADLDLFIPKKDKKAAILSAVAFRSLKVQDDITAAITEHTEQCPYGHKTLCTKLATHTNEHGVLMCEPCRSHSDNRIFSDDAVGKIGDA